MLKPGHFQANRDSWSVYTPGCPPSSPAGPAGIWEPHSRMRRRPRKAEVGRDGDPLSSPLTPFPSEAEASAFPWPTQEPPAALPACSPGQTERACLPSPCVLAKCVVSDVRSTPGPPGPSVKGVPWLGHQALAGLLAAHRRVCSRSTVPCSLC